MLTPHTPTCPPSSTTCVSGQSVVGTALLCFAEGRLLPGELGAAPSERRAISAHRKVSADMPQKVTFLASPLSSQQDPKLVFKSNGDSQHNSWPYMSANHCVCLHCPLSLPHTPPQVPKMLGLWETALFPWTTVTTRWARQGWIPAKRDIPSS